MVRRRGKVTAIGWAAGILVLLLVSVPAHAQEPIGYSESFDGEDAPGWVLDEGWRIEKGFLIGEDAARATYEDLVWGEMRFGFQLTSLTRTLQALFRLGEEGRYSVAVAQDADQLYLSLYRLVGDETPDRALTDGQYQIPIGDDVGAPSGVLIEIQYADGFITVFADGTLVMRYADPDPLPPGFIGFETSARGSAFIDEVSVEGIPPQEPEPSGPDLIVIDARVVDIEHGLEITVMIEVDIVNDGDLASGPSTLRVAATVDNSVGEAVEIGGLEPGQSRVEIAQLNLPSGWVTTSQSFLITADVGQEVEEFNEENNQFISEVVWIPSASAVPTEVPSVPSVTTRGRGGLAGALVVAGLAALAAFGLVTGGVSVVLLRRRARLSRRIQYEKQAKEQSPPDNCQPGQTHVEVETEMSFRRFKVQSVSIAVFDPAGQRRSMVTLESSFAADLDRAVRARSFGAIPPSGGERMADRSLAISTAIGDAAAGIIRHERSSCDLAISAHLEGIELTQTYTLYRCRGYGSAAGWERVTEWEVSRQATRDDVVTVAAGLNPLDETRLGRLGGEFHPHVRRYIERW